MRTVLRQYGKRYCTRLATTIMWGALGAICWGSAFAESRVHTVTIEGMKFSPEALEVKAGDTVVWKNKDIVPHNATASDHGFQSPTIPPNGTWKFRMRKKGEHDYLCTLHPTMKAKLTVK